MEAADSGKGLLPPGGTRYLEVATVTDAPQGAAITSTIAVLSGFTPLTARKYRLCGEVGGDCTSGWAGPKRAVLRALNLNHSSSWSIRV